MVYYIESMFIKIIINISYHFCENYFSPSHIVIDFRFRMVDMPTMFSRERIQEREKMLIGLKLSCS
jgi:hypothetical protein